MKSLSRKVLEHLDRVKVNEAYPKELTAIADKDSLRKLSYRLTDYGIDIQNSDIKPFEVRSTSDIRNAGVIIVVEPGIHGSIGAIENNGVSKGNIILNAEFTLNNGKRVKLKSASWKSMLEGGLKLFFIPNRVSNVDIQKERAAAKEGAVGLDRDANKQYKNDYTNSWATHRGYDKSGYKLDTNKYKRMLVEIKSEDNNWKRVTEKAIQEYESYMDLLKASPRNYSKGLAGRTQDKFFSGISGLLSSVGRLGDKIEDVFKAAQELDWVRAKAEAGELGNPYLVEYCESDLKESINNLYDERKETKKRVEEFRRG